MPPCILLNRIIHSTRNKKRTLLVLSRIARSTDQMLKSSKIPRLPTNLPDPSSKVLIPKCLFQHLPKTIKVIKKGVFQEKLEDLCDFYSVNVEQFKNQILKRRKTLLDPKPYQPIWKLKARMRKSSQLSWNGFWLRNISGWQSIRVKWRI